MNKGIELHGIPNFFGRFAAHEGDSTELTFTKALIAVVASTCSLCGLLWGLMYYLVFGLGITAALPLLFTLLVGSSIFVAHALGNYKILVVTQIICVTWITAMIQWSIGSLDRSGMVLAWSFLGPIGAMIFLESKRAIFLMVVWIGLVITTAVFEPNIFGIDRDIPISNGVKTLFYIMNIGVSSVIFFLGLFFFYKQRELALRLSQEVRGLEKTNHEQELLLRQNEKLATLGRLSAGVAHELNNPASAVQRGTERLNKAFADFKIAQNELAHLELDDVQLKIISKFDIDSGKMNLTGLELDALERTDREQEHESALEVMGISNGWEVAPVLVNLNFTKDDILELKSVFNSKETQIVLSKMVHEHTLNNLLQEIGQGSSRISEIINALKSYTYMDQAPRQFVDVQEGIEATLIMLRSKLKHGIRLHLDFSKDVPKINAYGSELNQVWTNLIDNAIDAMDGKGDLYIRTVAQQDEVVVEIKDTGGGIPTDVVNNIFDPFFTTKAFGKGTGLGLHISYNIVVGKHHGDIQVMSQPGETTFTVKLPVKLIETNENEKAQTSIIK